MKVGGIPRHPSEAAFPFHSTRETPTSVAPSSLPPIVAALEFSFWESFAMPPGRQEPARVTKTLWIQYVYTVYMRLDATSIVEIQAGVGEGDEWAGQCAGGEVGAWIWNATERMRTNGATE
ncbi:hypothetical protein Hypma_003122 [Hypsizygus marmoreus]|uniref:Uncharacterized protein n=1 Tax=Hypsizygus marmoreus TaxID=39966 RepID=A0A369J4X3_HYPMA|nr:hypothetical protein Hypma_003122 [Hypsizygus marmoreus]